ncbi:hypothetical protein LCGC14_1968070 [marine sediment metagenome]|uniref:Sodium/calcium exchanger membrane region domain-containing protein n=1 Tax=marine sediment metagenome TaxID=412755 RepID=A0A0F9FCX5_9ZZZZ
MDNKGQGGVTDLFLGLVIWAALTIAWVNISAELLTNIVAPLLSIQQFGSTGILIMNIGANLLWYLVPVIMIAAAFRGQRVAG